MSKTFELYKYYHHCGGGKMHVIAETTVSDMWMIDNGSKMYIAEERDGSMYGFSSNMSSPDTSPERKPLDLRSPLNEYPTQLGNIKPIGGCEQSAGNWFEIDQEIFLLEEKAKVLNIVSEKSFRGVFKDSEDFNYRYQLFIFRLPTGTQFYLVNNRQHSDRMLTPHVFTKIRDIMNELQDYVDPQNLITLEKELFKYSL